MTTPTDSQGKSGNGPLLDPAAFVRLREWGGDELLRKMIDLFLQNTPKRMEQIRAGVRDGDAEAIEDGAHSLKSSCANLGAEAARSRAAAMEQLGEDGRLEEARALLPELDTHYGETVDALTRIRDRGTVEAPDPDPSPSPRGDSE
jgi:HPt (histidine-containing phosphotransfer) domain-containing protein